MKLLPLLVHWNTLDYLPCPADNRLLFILNVPASKEQLIQFAATHSLDLEYIHTASIAWPQRRWSLYDSDYSVHSQWVVLKDCTDAQLCQAIGVVSEDFQVSEEIREVRDRLREKFPTCTQQIFLIG